MGVKPYSECYEYKFDRQIAILTQIICFSECRFCEKGFPRATDLTVHERYHTNEKTHLCNLCGKGFQRAYNLLVHMRVHSELYSKLIVTNSSF